MNRNAEERGAGNGEPRTPRLVFRHLTGARAAATAAAGLGLGLGGAALAARALRGAEGWPFEALAGAALLAAAAVVGTLPRRLATRVGAEGVSVGWALGRRHIPWSGVRRAVVGTLGSGGERDPACVSLLLREGTEVLFAVLGRRRPDDDPACRALREACLARGIPWDDAAAPLEERRERERAWRAARLKGWR